MADEPVDPSDIGEVDAPPVSEAPHESIFATDEIIFATDESVAGGQSRTASSTSSIATPTRRSRPTRRAT